MISSLRFIMLTSIVIAAFSVGCGPGDPNNPADSLNEAAIIGWNDGIKTDVKFSEFGSDDFTLTAWAYPLVTHGMDMEIFGRSSAGGLSVGYADHWSIAEASPCENSLEFSTPTAKTASKLYVQIDPNNRRLYCVPMTPYHWHMISLVNQKVQTEGTTLGMARKLELWIDGKKMTASGAQTDIEYFAGFETPNPLGTSEVLTLGRSVNPALLSGKRSGQYHGLLDDVSVFKKALSAAELAAQIASNGGRLNGSEEGLLAGIRFDSSDSTAPAGTLAPSLARPWSHLDSDKTIQTLLVSALRNDKFDKPLMDSALDQLVRNSSLTLPIAAGVPWYVIQDIDTSVSSHKGYGVFCWDFEYAGQTTPGNNPNQADTLNQPVYAAVTAPIVYVEECQALHGAYPPNVVAQQILPDFLLSYLHLVPNSVSPLLGTSQKCNQGGLNLPVNVGQQIAATGDSGLSNPGAYHIHFAATNLPDSAANNSQLITFPTAFSNYQASDDLGKTWNNIKVGIPRAGQWVRR